MAWIAETLVVEVRLHTYNLQSTYPETFKSEEAIPESWTLVTGPWQNNSIWIQNLDKEQYGLENQVKNNILYRITSKILKTKKNHVGIISQSINQNHRKFFNKPIKIKFIQLRQEEEPIIFRVGQQNQKQQAKNQCPVVSHLD